MKKIFRFFCLAFCLFFVSQHSFGQDVASVFKKETIITWLGVDFSSAKYIGDTLTTSTAEMITMPNKINGVIFNEPKKYDFGKAFDKDSVSYNLEPTIAVNKEVKGKDFLSMNKADCNRLTPERIASMVNAYPWKDGMSGVGLVFIVDCMDKTTESMFVWVTFVDMSTHKVILTERVKGEAAGFGFRNHWAGAINSVLKHVKGDFYKLWKKKYTGSK